VKNKKQKKKKKNFGGAKKLGGTVKQKFSRMKKNTQNLRPDQPRAATIHLQTCLKKQGKAGKGGVEKVQNSKNGKTRGGKEDFSQTKDSRLSIYM